MPRSHREVSARDGGGRLRSVSQDHPSRSGRASSSGTIHQRTGGGEQQVTLRREDSRNRRDVHSIRREDSSNRHDVHSIRREDSSNRHNHQGLSASGGRAAAVSINGARATAAFTSYGRSSSNSGSRSSSNSGGRYSSNNGARAAAASISGSRSSSNSGSRSSSNSGGRAAAAVISGGRSSSTSGGRAAAASISGGRSSSTSGARAASNLHESSEDEVDIDEVIHNMYVNGMPRSYPGSLDEVHNGLIVSLYSCTRVWHKMIETHPRLRKFKDCE